MKRTQKSQKKTKFLLLLIVLTAILSITATYAWFSTQRDVEITGMRLNVEVAESMQISLNGETWVQSISIDNMRQFYHTHQESTHQAVAISESTTNLNYVPKELLPVSSDGTVTSGKLNFVTGTIVGTTLTEVTACSESDITKAATIANREAGNASHPYLVFDMYLRNISATTGNDASGNANRDTLQLNEGSRVYINSAVTQDEGVGVADTGLEYSSRVGFVLYQSTVSATSTSETIGEDVRSLAATGDETAAIWEPNDLEHTVYVVNNDAVGLTQTSQAFTTSALKYSVASATNTVTDIYTSATAITPVNTMKPAYDADGLTDAVDMTDVNGNKVGLLPNTISKVRVYIWLEGQDPDCIDLASTGDKLSIDLKLTKQGSDSTGITYVD